MLFSPHFIHQTKHAGERQSKYDYESMKFYQAFFYERKSDYLLFTLCYLQPSVFHIF